MLWIALPALLAWVLYFLRRWRTVSTVIALAAALLLAALAWRLPLDQALPLRFWPGVPTIRLASLQVIFGSPFVVSNTLRPLLGLLYLSTALWLGGVWVSGDSRLFAPLALGLTALFSAALAAPGFSSSAMLLALGVPLILPLVSPPGEEAKGSALRLLSHLTLGLLLIAVADSWLAQAILAEAVTEFNLSPALLALGLGFVLTAALVPFHTWVTRLGEESSPLIASYFLFVFPLTLNLLGAQMLQRYAAAPFAAALSTAVRYGGIWLVLMSGVNAAFERHLGRALAWTALVQAGWGWLALTLPESPLGEKALEGLFLALVPSRGLALAVGGLSLAILAKNALLSWEAQRGAAFRFPLASATLLLALLSSGGWPLLASFPALTLVGSSLGQDKGALPALVLLGSAGVAFFALRLAILFLSPAGEERWRLSESDWQIGFLGIGAALLIGLGLLPQTYLPLFVKLGTLFLSPPP